MKDFADKEQYGLRPRRFTVKEKVKIVLGAVVGAIVLYGGLVSLLGFPDLIG